jgi:alkyl hydroperoxide reductase subunit AhpC
MKEMPNVIKLYNDFHPKGLEIMGVSLDKARDAWLGAIRNKKLPWIMVSDVKFWQSIVVPLYNVSAIPYTVLLDKEGRIIAKNLRGEDLYKKVESLLK